MERVETKTHYAPTALYYADADSLEYVRNDVPHVYRRIDEFLTIILDVHSREAVGFKIKGFRHFYLSTLKPDLSSRSEFPRLVTVLERLMTDLGESLFNETFRHEAYATAADIARRDQVIVSDWPSAA